MNKDEFKAAAKALGQINPSVIAPRVVEAQAKLEAKVLMLPISDDEKAELIEHMADLIETVCDQIMDEIHDAATRP